ncbi:MAG: trypsin-like peptidase domain-containing protein [Deltaproteobacteria bacterium]|jgi:serine protease Do
MFKKVLVVKLACGLLLLASIGMAGAASAQTSYLGTDTFADLAQASGEAVVNISTEKTVRPHFGHQPLENFFEQFLGPLHRTLRIHSLGSGIIMDPEGYVITNNHAVAGAQKIKIILMGGKEFQGVVKGRDPETDLALVHIVNPPPNLPFLKLGDSDAVRIGDWVLAVGNPFGLSHTVTQGIISAKGRVIGDSPYDKFLQTDASINPGNSGGPLLNLKGEVIGINTAILVHGQGIGFAIPSNIAKTIIPILKEKGKVTRGMIGIMAETVTPRLVQKLKLSQTSGVLVVKVNPGMPAQKAGIKPGDIIINYHGHAVETMRQLLRLVGNTAPGTEVTVIVVRHNQEKKFKVKITELSEKRRAEVTKNMSLDFWKKILPEGWIKSRRPATPQLVM